MHRNYFHWRLFTFFGRLCRWTSFDKDGMITPYGIHMALVNRKNASSSWRRHSMRGEKQNEQTTRGGGYIYVDLSGEGSNPGSLGAQICEGNAVVNGNDNPLIELVENGVSKI